MKRNRDRFQNGLSEVILEVLSYGLVPIIVDTGVLAEIGSQNLAENIFSR